MSTTAIFISVGIAILVGGVYFAFRPKTGGPWWKFWASGASDPISKGGGGFSGSGSDRPDSGGGPAQT